MELYVYISSFLHSERKFLKLKNFEVSIQKIVRADGGTNTVEESRIHVKYITVREQGDRKLVLDRGDNGEKIKLSTETEEDLTNLVKAIETEKKNYESFLKDYYTNNDSYNLIEGESFFDYFEKVINFLKDLNDSLNSITMDENLEQILTVQNKFIIKINYYVKLLESSLNQLNSDRSQEERDLITRSKEIKELLNELKEVILTCTYNLTCPEIEEYIKNFKSIMSQKSKEIMMIIDEIKYNLTNYLALKNDNPEENFEGDVFNTKEEELSKMLLENENLKIQIENLEIENKIISEFLAENKK